MTVLSEEQILQRFDELVESGDVFYDKNTEAVPYVENGFKFLFLLATSLSKKPNAPDEKDTTDQKLKPPLQPGSDINTAGYEICDVGTTHRLCANKFCYTRPQLLLLTRDGFKRQWDPLEAADLDAAWRVLQPDHIAFYNCGTPAGFSRLHRHVQFLPRPEGLPIFLDRDCDEADNQDEDNEDDDNEDRDGRAAVPFLYFRRRLDGSGRDLLRVYEELRRRMAERSPFRWTGEPGTDCPHNFLMTREWMAVIPRRTSVFATASANTVGMIGLLPVSSRKNMEEWKRLGVLRVLRQFGVPKDAVAP